MKCSGLQSGAPDVRRMGDAGSIMHDLQFVIIIATYCTTPEQLLEDGWILEVLVSFRTDEAKTRTEMGDW